MFRRFNQVLFLVVILRPPLQTVQFESKPVTCFYDTRKTCANVLEPMCMVDTKDNDAVVCCNLNETNLLEHLNDIPSKKYCSLHIQNSNFKDFTLKLVDWRKTLKSIAITDGRMAGFYPNFTRFTSMQCLNLSSNGLTHITKLAEATNLRSIDLSNNSLSEIPEFRANLTSSNITITIDISDNKVRCGNLQDKLRQYKDNLNFENTNKTWCLVSPNDKIWYNHSERLLLSQIEKLTQVIEDCPLKNCTCSSRRLDRSTPTDASVALMVDCSLGGYQSLPAPLPENCVALNVSHNNISSLGRIDDPSYDNLRELYAAHNNITSIDDLEGSKFIQNFVRLDLRHNNIRSIKIHSLKDAFDRMTSTRELSLGQNFFECDCHAAKVLKDWMLRDIRDSEEIYCVDKQDVKVTDLDPSDLCRIKQSWTDYIYYIIAAEVLLLTSLIAKVSYDYWVFKSTGYLPWPASKMPKLPCDWLCE